MLYPWNPAVAAAGGVKIKGKVTKLKIFISLKSEQFANVKIILIFMVFVNLLRAMPCDKLKFNASKNFHSLSIN